MKKIISVTLAMLFAVLCVIPAFAASYECALTADKTRVKVGDTITVDVYVSQGFAGGHIEVFYDANSLEIVETSKTDKILTEIGTGHTGKIGIASAGKAVNEAISLCTVKFKVNKLHTKITADIIEFLDSNDDDHYSQITAPVLTISPIGTVSSNTKITPATTAPATTKASAPVTQAPAAQNNQQNNSQNNSQQPAQSDNSAASNSSANSNAQTNANTTANSTPAVTTQVAAQTENTVPEIATNATEAVSENTDAMTVGADEKKSIIPLIVAIVAALASLAAIIFIIVKKKKESDEGEEQSNPEK